MTNVESDFSARLRRAQRGDREALTALLAPHLGALRAFVRLRGGRVVLRRESCSDVVQSVCRHVVQSLDAVEAEEEPRFVAWLYSIARNRVQDRVEYWRAQKRDAGEEHGDAAADAASDPALRQAYAAIASPSEEAMGREELECFEAAFSRLSDDHREVILLTRIEGLTSEEVGERMGRTPEAARQLLSRALARLFMVWRGGAA